MDLQLNALSQRKRRKSMSRLSLISLVALFASLQGCGGGAGSDSPAPVQNPVPTPTPAPVPPPPPAPTPGGPSYFYFSSSNDAASALTTATAKSELGRYSNVVAGIDAGGDTQSPDFRSQAQQLKALGYRLHVYLEGPGGPTGSSWSSDECARVHAAAKLYVSATVPSGDACQNDAAAWMVEWNQTGFFKQLQQQLVDLQPLGVESVEVDNLYRAGYGAGYSPLAEFVQRFGSGKALNNPVKLLLKNVGSGPELDAILATAPRSAIADFMIVEEDFKSNWCAIAQASKLHAITTVFSWDTSDYHAEAGVDGKDLVLAGPLQTERSAFSCH
jgi:hypothetical protein